MGWRNRLVLALLALDAGRWWAADSARDRLRAALGAVDERLYEFFQSALERLEPSRPIPKPMDRIRERDRAEIEWAFLVARLRTDSGGSGSPAP
ncbi:hypothetical protein ACFT7S_10630 [Streptomyces sp. NPDC057136]|uniref:hypothetical protein n=1 Tax=Streptomyces sp. NPDC057136 TaxID=3346029 RepID=UPI003626E999